MRTLTRHRNTLSRTVSSIALRMQKAMQQMNIKLTYYPEVSISQTVLLLVQHRTEHPNIRGGKRISSYVPHRRNNVGLIFRSIASSLANVKNQLENFYRRIRSRAGGKAAVIATAHKAAEICFAMVANQTTYNPEKGGIDEKVLLEKRITRYKRELEQITGTHIDMGYTGVP